MGYFGKSFYKQQQDLIREELGEELLELTLKYLPHLQPQKQQNDYWELIAIKLNEHLALKRIEERRNENPQQSLDEIPTINGPRVKEIFEYEMKHTVLSIHAQPDKDSSSNFVVIVPRERKPRIVHELRALWNYDVELLAEKSKTKLRGSWDRYLEDEYREIESSAAKKEEDESGKNTQAELFVEKAREVLREKLIESLMGQISQRDKKIDKLSGEVKKLLDLNHALVERE